MTMTAPAAVSRALATTLQREANDALREVFARHGLTLDQRSRATYGDSFTLKVTAYPAAPEGEVVNSHTPEAQGFLAVATMLGFTSEQARELLGATVPMQGEDWIFAGFKTRSPKRPCVFKRVRDGKTYIFPKTALRSLPGYDAAKDVW